MATAWLIAMAAAQAPPMPQQQQPPPELLQALQQRLLGEINAALQCSAGSIALHAENAKLRGQIAELEAKLPKPGPSTEGR